jgi:hypothetical protein
MSDEFQQAVQRHELGAGHAQVAPSRVSDAHSEPSRTRRNDLADAAEPDNPELLARSSVPSMKSNAQPFQPPRRSSRSAFRQPAGDREDQRPREIGDRLGEHVRSVRDDDPLRFRVGDVDVVVADGDIGGDLQAGRRVDHGPDRSGPSTYTLPASLSPIRAMSSSWGIVPSSEYRSTRRRLRVS